jgi:small conductance mechanosensitive channel
LVDIVPLVVPLLYFAVIIVLTWLVARLASITFGRIMRRSMPIVAAQVRRIVWVLTWLVGSLLAVEQLGIRSDILLLMVGLFGAGTIVALRAPLENIGARYFLDVYAPFKVGDSIRVQEHSGTVIEVNSMSIILLTEDERLVSIPNSAFVKEVVVNTTPQAWREVIIPITIGSDIDLAEFESDVLKSVSKLKLHLDKRFPPVLTTKTRSPQSTELTLTVMLHRPEQRDAIVAEVNNRVTEIIESIKRTKK